MSQHALTTYTDEELMRAAQGGNRQAFELIYERYAGQLFGYFFRMLRKEKEVAEDYTQELFLKIIHKKESYQGDRSFKTWVFSIAHNMCKNNYRKAEIVARAATELKMKNKPTYDTQQNPDKKAFRIALDNALMELNQAKRACFIMRFKQGLSIKEIAEVENVSVGTIKSRIFYTLKELTAQLKEFNPQYSHGAIK